MDAQSYSTSLACRNAISSLPSVVSWWLAHGNRSSKYPASTSSTVTSPKPKARRETISQRMKRVLSERGLPPTSSQQKALIEQRDSDSAAGSMPSALVRHIDTLEELCIKQLATGASSILQHANMRLVPGTDPHFRPFVCMRMGILKLIAARLYPPSVAEGNTFGITL